MARDAVLDRTVAVKLLPPEFVSDPDRLRRFELEARATGRLSHPHIVSIFDAGLHGTQPYLVTELLDGETLGARLAKGPLSVATALQLTRQVAHALGAAHALGVVHRDLKPDNILITREGTGQGARLRPGQDRCARRSTRIAVDENRNDARSGDGNSRLHGARAD